MATIQTAFQIDKTDNVATALCALTSGQVKLFGDAQIEYIQAVEDISVGHKIALCDIQEGEEIIKYGVVIGAATKDIPCGSWVHLHCIRSLYDERSSHLDVITGAPADIAYE